VLKTQPNSTNVIACKGGRNVRSQQGLKLFVVMFICTVFMYSFSHFGVLAYQALTTESNQYVNGTIAGTVDLTGKTKSEAHTLLTEHYQKWQNETTIEIQYKEKKIPVDISIFQFDIESTIGAIVNGQKNSITVTVKHKDVQDLVKQLSPSLTLTVDESNKFTSNLVRFASELTTGTHNLLLEEVLSQTYNRQEVINQVELDLYDVTVEMSDWIKTLSPIVVEPQAKLSLVKLFEEKHLANMPDSIKSMVATGIYETILSTNFSIIERHTSQLLPDYAKLGYEANIDVKNHHNFMFSNPNSSRYQIELQWKDNRLVILLKGSKFLYEYEVKLGEVQQFKPRTIIQYNPLLKGEKRVQQEGIDGNLVKVYREVFSEKGEWLEKEFIAEDYYPPVHRIEIHRLNSTSPTEENVTTSEIHHGTESTNSTVTSGTTSTSSSDDQTEDGLWGKPNETKK
jgi:hypothetical protein